MEENGFLMDEFSYYFTKLIEVDKTMHEITIESHDDFLLIRNIKINHSSINVIVTGQQIKKYLSPNLINKDFIHELLVLVVRDMIELIKLSESNSAKAFDLIHIDYRSLKETKLNMIINDPNNTSTYLKANAILNNEVEE